MNADEKTPVSAGGEQEPSKILVTALRQYMHNDGSGLVAGYEYEETQRIVAAMAAELEQARGEISDLHTTMMAAAVEIQEQWSAHCDEEGYGPANLMHRLEHGIASQYGYTAETLVRTEARLEALRAELEAARKQEPVAECVEFGRHANIIPTEHGKAVLAHGAKLYALPPLAGQVSVPRELLRRVCWPVVSGSDRHTHSEAVAELRALLATPSMEV